MGLDFVRVMFINVFLMIVGRDVSTMSLHAWTSCLREQYVVLAIASTFLVMMEHSPLCRDSRGH